MTSTDTKPVIVTDPIGNNPQRFETVMEALQNSEVMMMYFKNKSDLQRSAFSTRLRRKLNDITKEKSLRYRVLCLGLWWKYADSERLFTHLEIQQHNFQFIADNGSVVFHSITEITDANTSITDIVLQGLIVQFLATLEGESFMQYGQDNFSRQWTVVKKISADRWTKARSFRRTHTLTGESFVFAGFNTAIACLKGKDGKLIGCRHLRACLEKVDVYFCIYGYKWENLGLLAKHAIDNGLVTGALVPENKVETILEDLSVNPWNSRSFPKPSLSNHSAELTQRALNTKSLPVLCKDMLSKTLFIHYCVHVLKIPLSAIDTGFSSSNGIGNVDKGDTHFNPPSGAIAKEPLRIELKFSSAMHAQKNFHWLVKGIDTNKLDFLVVFGIAHNSSHWNHEAIEYRFKRIDLDPKFQVAEDVDFSRDALTLPDLLDPEVQKRLFVHIIPKSALTASHVYLPAPPTHNLRNWSHAYMYRYNDPRAILAFGDFFKDLPAHVYQFAQENVKDQEDRKVMPTKRRSNPMRNLASFKEQRENDDDDDESNGDFEFDDEDDSDGNDEFEKNLPVPEDDCRSTRGISDVTNTTDGRTGLPPRYSKRSRTVTNRLGLPAHDKYTNMDESSEEESHSESESSIGEE